MSVVDIKENRFAGKPIVLVVDDDLDHLNKLREVLKEDYNVYTVSGGLEAFGMIKDLPQIQALVVNNDLSSLKGTEILRFIQDTISSSGDIVKILLTSNSFNIQVIDSLRMARPDALLEKPVTVECIKNKIAYHLARRAKEKRASMRINFDKSARIQVDGETSQQTELVDISENGMFLRTLSLSPEGTTLPFKIFLPDGKQYSVTGRIVRVDKEKNGVGVEFLTMGKQSRLSLLQSLSNFVTLKDLSRLKERYPFLKTEEMVIFSDGLKIETFLRQAMESEVEVVALRGKQTSPEILKMTGVAPPLSCVLEGEKLNIKFKTSDLIFLSFQLGYSTYNFETMIYRISPDGKTMECLYPRVMFYSDKRNERRIKPFGNLRLEIPLSFPFDKKIRGKIIDISPGGVSFLADQEAPVLLKGTPLDRVCIFDSDDFLWEEKGEVRYVTKDGAESEDQVRYGIQFGIGRMGIQSVLSPKFDLNWTPVDLSEKVKSKPAMRRADDISELAYLPPQVIHLENQKGEQIVGLLNSSFPLDEKPVPVVLIPPAFGKTKETLFSLALILIENFRFMGKPLAVIRYDGIKRKGESHKDPDSAEPPFELINADFTQGAEDIKTWLDWLKSNSKLKAGKIILISFSLSSLEARIVLRDKANRKRISLWISCMGTPEFRDLMTRVNCGLDFLEQYQLGIPMGVMPVLGNLVNVDSYVADGVVNEVATLEKAREDMRHIDIPVTWVIGEYDKWVKPEFIRDVMSVEARVPREVISVPIGHNARTSEEALRLFGTLTSLIYRFLHQEMIQPFVPSKKRLKVMRRAEKDRLPSRNLKNRKAYWHRYLVGDENLLGFDIMALGDDYKQLMEDQLEALELDPEDRLLDLGGGTGNLVEHLLENRALLPAQITIADLIPEARKKAGQKLTQASDDLKQPGRLNFVTLDLEMSRFLPVQRFLKGETATFEELADTIENLDLESARKIQQSYSPRLHAILRGGQITSKLDEWLQSNFDIPEYRTIIDFNKVSRYVRGLVPEKPNFQKLLFPGTLMGNFHLPLRPGWYNKILLSLVLSYIFNPLETLFEIRRIIKPNGRLVLSTMRPDADASGPFTRLLEKIEHMPEKELPSGFPKSLLLESLRSFLNDAQALVDLEEAGTFDFFDPEKLEGLLEQAGWDILRIIPTFGEPPQGYVMIAKERESHGC
ncbi:MAG: PilZ domain-containing protein [Acidobacteriota bacterium]